MKKLMLAVAALAMLAGIAAADTVTTTVWFNVPSDVSFSVTLPGESPVSSGATTDIEYNSTVPTLAKINCTVREAGPQGAQTAAIPCFNYSNTGNRAINVTLAFGSNLPTGVTVKAGQNNSAWIASCTCADLITGCPGLNDCVVVATSSSTPTVKVANIAYAGYKEVWMWADYSGYTGGATNQRALTHTSQAD
jgi:hypothetical protein